MAKRLLPRLSVQELFQSIMRLLASLIWMTILVHTAMSSPLVIRDVPKEKQDAKSQSSGKDQNSSKGQASQGSKDPDEKTNKYGWAARGAGVGFGAGLFGGYMAWGIREGEGDKREDPPRGSQPLPFLSTEGRPMHGESDSTLLRQKANRKYD